MEWQAPGLTPKHEAGGLRLLCGVRTGWAGVTAVFLLLYVAGVLRALAAAPLSHLYCADGHLRPPL
jgi:hypothetical protein